MRYLIPLLLFSLSACQTAERKPNVIYILADDLGYGEVGAYGQTQIKTPNLDRLAAEGLRFTQHYSGSPVCAPSRGSLLTGKHTGHGYVRDNLELGGWGPDEPEGQLPLKDSEVTIAEMLKPLGYATGFIGKWGLGGPDGVGQPNKQGFDHFYGYLCQRVAHNYYPTHLWRNGERDSLKGNAPWFTAHERIDSPLDTEMEYYARYQRETFAPDKMIEEALGFVRDNQENPFLLVYATPIPHLALQVPVEALAQYAGQFEEMPFPGQPYLPHPKPLSAYAAMISTMDANIGRLVELVDELGLGEDTIIMFSSDNGTTYSGGVQAEYFNSTAGLRGLKGSVFEGGVRVPMIARWPGQIAPGTVSEHISAFWDVMPTIADLTGAEAPGGIDGVSFSSVLSGGAASTGERPLYWEYHAFGGMQAVRMGQWKGVRLRARENPDAPLLVFDLDTDPSETTDLYDARPDIAARLDSVMQTRTISEISRWNFGDDYSSE
ncbi:MAG: arylsulfatase A [Rhodothermales bacterium]|jgi:arylsulfatase A